MKWVLGLLGLSLAACALSGREPRTATGDAGAAAPASPRGSLACQGWQDAFCGYLSDRCGRLSREVCDRQNQGVVCRDDALAERCARAFDQASCSHPPAGCEVIDLSDGAAAARLCESYYDALCDSNIRCGLFATQAECRAHPAFAFDCDQALAVSLDLDACVDRLRTRACDEPVPLCDNVVHR